MLGIPPLIGKESGGARDNDMGQQATFSMLLVAYLRDHARELVQRGGVAIPGEVLVRISSDAASIGSETINALLVNKGVKLFGSVASHRLGAGHASRSALPVGAPEKIGGRLAHARPLESTVVPCGVRDLASAVPSCATDRVQRLVTFFRRRF